MKTRLNESMASSSRLHWFREGQKHCSKSVSKISCEDAFHTAFTLMLSVAYGGLTECIASLLFGLTVYRVSRRACARFM
jgi:hypothetical protein